jgi:hypothetical protein
MAEVNPPLFVLQNGAYGPDELGLPLRDLIGEGVVGPSSGELAVTQRAAGANWSVDIAKGSAYVKGDADADRQPTYRVYNDGVRNLAITPADATNPRKTIVIAEVIDGAFGGAGYKWQLRAVDGVPAVAPAEPALPPNAVKLAVLTIPAGAGSVVTAYITDARTSALVGGGAAGLNTVKPQKKTTARVINGGSAGTAEYDLLNGEFAVAAGSMGASGALRLTAWGDSLANAGVLSGFRFKLKLGATTLLDTGVGNPGQMLSSDANRYGWRIQAEILNLGATNAQWATILGNFVNTPNNGGVASFAVGEGRYVAGNGGAPQALTQFVGGNIGAVDTTVAQALALSVILPASSASLEIKLLGALLEAF